MQKRRWNGRLQPSTREPTCSRSRTTEAIHRHPPNCSPPSSRNLRSFRWGHAIRSAIRAERCWLVYKRCTCTRTAPISMARSASSWMGIRLRFGRGLVANIFLFAKIVLVARCGLLAVFLDDSASFVGILLTNQDHYAADGEHFLLGVERLGHGINACGFEQAAHHESFGFLFAVEDLDQLFIGIERRIRFRTSCHAASQ